MGVFGSSAALIINALGGLYLLAVLLRFLLQIAKADFYNPLSQAVVRVTDPMVRVFRNFIPGYRGIDFSSLILAIVIEGIAICVLIFLTLGQGKSAALAVLSVALPTTYYAWMQARTLDATRLLARARAGRRRPTRS